MVTIKLRILYPVNVDFIALAFQNFPNAEN
jgi:hypothetical protein